ncbi:MAG: transcriptional regulator [Burkholderiales bacterium]|jgi:antitoxin VapB|nr:MAG: transcriptional regulator [Burkholderiales bacterium]
MALQIANPKVVEKVERLARAMGTTKTAAVEEAVDRLLVERSRPGKLRDRIESLLEQIDRIPDRSDAFDPLEWDEQGLPK